DRAKAIARPEGRARDGHELLDADGARRRARAREGDCDAALDRAPGAVEPLTEEPQPRALPGRQRVERRLWAVEPGLQERGTAQLVVDEARLEPGHLGRRRIVDRPDLRPLGGTRGGADLVVIGLRPPGEHV